VRGGISGRLLTAREVADRLGVSTGALLRWTRAGQVPAVKLPSGAVRYVPEQIAAWLEAQAMAGDATEEVSPTPNATRRSEVSFLPSPIPLRTAAPTEEESDGRT
jgi:excisionase family DNA binding protein